MRRLALPLLLLVVLAAPAAALDRAPRSAIDKAKARAAKHFGGDRSRVKATFSMRSARNRSWALVTGERGRRIWAAWMRRGSDGRWRVSIFRTRVFDPGPRVPCDIKPAFSEPSC